MQDCYSRDDVNALVSTIDRVQSDYSLVRTVIHDLTRLWSRVPEPCLCFQLLVARSFNSLNFARCSSKSGDDPAVSGGSSEPSFTCNASRVSELPMLHDARQDKLSHSYIEW